MKLVEWIKENLQEMLALRLQVMLASFPNAHDIEAELLESDNGTVLHCIILKANQITSDTEILEEKQQKILELANLVLQYFPDDEALKKLLLTRDDDKRTPLHYLFSGGNILKKILECLHSRIRLMPEPLKLEIALAPDRWRRNIFHYQAINLNCDEFYIQTYGDAAAKMAFSQLDCEVKSPLHHSCNQADSVEKFFKINMIFNFVKSLAIENANALLHALGFNVDKDGRTPLYYFCLSLSAKYPAQAQAVIAAFQLMLGVKYASYLLFHERAGNTPLHALREPWNLAIVSALLNGISPEQRKLLALIAKMNASLKILDVAALASHTDRDAMMSLFNWPGIFIGCDFYGKSISNNIRDRVNLQTCFFRAVNYFLEHQDLYSPASAMTESYLTLLEDFADCLANIKMGKPISTLTFVMPSQDKDQNEHAPWFHFNYYIKLRRNFPQCVAAQVEECESFFKKFAASSDENERQLRVRVLAEIFRKLVPETVVVYSSKSRWTRHLRFWSCSLPESQPHSADLSSTEILMSRLEH
jgi:hypothetical protein